MIELKILAVSLIVILCADIATTWWLLVNYRKQVYEDGTLGKLLFKSKFYGHLMFCGIRIVLVALAIEYMGWAGMAAMQIVTGYAVINNLFVIRRLHG